jgi:group I intron endonuclease
MKTITGIYMIECVANGKKYIGQSLDIRKRCYGHTSLLRSNKHDNKYLQLAWNKYGGEAFEFWILREDKKENLNELEELFISELETTDRDEGFNLTSGGNSSRHAEESIDKIVASNNLANKQREVPFWSKTVG